MNPTDTIKDLEREIKEQRVIVNKIYTSVEKTRKYFLWTMWVTIALFVIPLIISFFAIPAFLSTYTSALSGASLGL